MNEITREQKIEWLEWMREDALFGPAIPDAILADYVNGVVRDKCEFCLGTKGGAPGNENIVNGKVMCDHCHAMLPEKSPVRFAQAPALLAALEEIVHSVTTDHDLEVEDEAHMWSRIIAQARAAIAAARGAE